MANEVLVKTGTPICFANTGDYVANSGYAQTHQLNLTSLADDAARMSAYADLGAARAAGYAVRVGIELDVAAGAGVVVDFYWAAGPGSGGAVIYDGGVTGADGAYKAAEEDEWVKQLIYIGSLVCTNDASPMVQVQTIATRFEPPTRAGCVVVHNKTGQAFEGDAVEMFVALIPIVDEVQ